jgi:hypothetical protein
MKTALARSKPPLLTPNKHDVSAIARVEIERNVPPGNLRANGPANTLCSYCVVASTTYATSPPMDSIISRHSIVGATGSWTQSRPSLILTIVHRTLVLTPRSNPMPCSCSSVHTLFFTTSRATVRLERNGTRGKGKPVKLTYRRFASSSDVDVTSSDVARTAVARRVDDSASPACFTDDRARTAAAAAGIAACLDARGDTRGRVRHREASATASIIIALVDMVHSLFPSTR